MSRTNVNFSAFSVEEKRHPARYSEDPDAGKKTRIAAVLQTVGVPLTDRSGTYSPITNIYSREHPYISGLPGMVTYWLSGQSIFKAARKQEGNHILSEELSHAMVEEEGEPDWKSFLQSVEEGNHDETQFYLYFAVVYFLSRCYIAPNTESLPWLTQYLAKAKNIQPAKAESQIAKAFEKVDTSHTITLDELIEKSAPVPEIKKVLPLALIGYWAQCLVNYDGLINAWNYSKQEFAAYSVPSASSIIVPVHGDDEFKRRYHLPTSTSQINEAAKDGQHLTKHRPRFQL